MCKELSKLKDLLVTIYSVNMAAKAPTVSTPKRDNSHMSPPDKNIQTKITVLSPKFKELFVSSLRKGIQQQTDGYDTEDEVPLSQLRKKGATRRAPSVAQPGKNIDDSIMITDDLSQNTTAPVTTIEGALNRGETTTLPERAAKQDDLDQRNEVGSTALTKPSIPVQGASGGDGESNGSSVPIDIGPAEPIDPLLGVNKEQLIADVGQDNQNVMLIKLWESVQVMNKKLDKLDVLEKEIGVVKDNMVKKEDVEKMVKEQLIPVKTVLTKQDIILKKQQNQLDIMKEKTEKCMESVDQCLEQMKRETEKDAAKSSLDKKEIEEMIRKACESDQMGGNDETKGEHTRNKPNKNLIIHGIEEDRKVEDLVKVQDVAHDIGLRLHRWDVDKTSRIGAYEKDKRRPVKVELVSEITKLDFLKSKKKLKSSEYYADIQVVPDETKEVRRAKAVLRQAAYLATRRGDRVWKRHDLIWVNGTKYTVNTVDDIPDDL